jgi:hypothetical protein
LGFLAAVTDSQEQARKRRPIQTPPDLESLEAAESPYHPDYKPLNSRPRTRPRTREERLARRLARERQESLHLLRSIRTACWIVAWFIILSLALAFVAWLIAVTTPPPTYMHFRF